jgi:hypothetical protein
MQLTLDQLWKGLILKLTHPQRFDHQIKHCHVGWLNHRQFIREQQYPTLKVEDKVTLTPQSAISIHSMAYGSNAFSLSIDIKATPEHQIILHYQYQRSSANYDDLDTDQYLALAYKQADEAAIEQIKSLVSLGELV